MKSILIKLFIIGLCVSFFPIQAIAEGQTGWHLVERLYQRECKANRGLEVELATAHDNPDACDSQFVLEVPCVKASKKGHAGQRLKFEEKANIFYLAFDGDYEVQAFVGGCDEEGQAQVSAVQVRKPAP